MAASSRKRRRRIRTWIPIVLLISVLAGGYVTADVYDIVPGALTLTEPGDDPEPYPSVSPATPQKVRAVEFDDATSSPSGDAVDEAVGRFAEDPRVGQAGVVVTDLLSGDVIASHEPERAEVPASTIKLLTVVAALEAAGPDHRFTTEVISGSAEDPDAITLVAGGDLTLAAEGGDEGAVVGHAGMADLAGQVASALRADGRGSVSRVVLDESLWTGPRMAPRWDDADLEGGWAMPMAPIAIEMGVVDGRTARSSDPGGDALTAFVRALTNAGITVDGDPTIGAAAGGTMLGSVESAPLGEIVAHTLVVSENILAESLGRLAALETGAEPSFAGAGEAILAQLRELGVDTTGVMLSDASGLSSADAATPAALAQTLRAAAYPDHPRLLAAIRGLPVAGLEGTLAHRFEGGPAAGLIAAKTGSLRTTATMAGQVHTTSGRVLVVVAMTNDWTDGIEQARAGIDDFFTKVAQL